MQALTALIENNSDVMSFVSSSGKVLYASPSVATLFGYLPKEVVGRNTIRMIHPEDRDHSRRVLGEVLARPRVPLQAEMRVRHKNGDWRRVESAISNLLEEPRVGAIVVNSREIGARRAVRQQEQRQTDDLVLANARLEDFAYAVMHDLREPLRTISMFTQLLTSQTDLSAEGKMQADFITNGVARMSALLEGLHSFAISGFAESAQPVAMGPVAAEVVRSLGHAIASTAATVTIDPLPSVQGNEKHLLRVLQNLLANALKYRSEAPVRIHVTAERLGREWVIKVKDNGVGIAKEHYEQIFGLFKRLHGTETPGAGIGLAVCKKIIESMGGEIWVESKPGSGSTFCFTVAAAEGIAPAKSAERPLLWGTKRGAASDTAGHIAQHRMRKAAGAR
jgi:PAS domain S-box-containing protein